MLVDRDAFGRNSFQLVRLVLAVCVLYRHSFDLLAAPHADLVLDLIPPRTHLGRIALCLFLVISGFLVTQSWEHSAGWRDFLWRRVLRIYPAFLVACLFSALVAAPLGSPAPLAYLASVDLLTFGSAVLQLGKLEIPPSFLANPYPGQVNGSLWSIKIEFECYLLLMALGLLGVLRRRTVVLSLFAAALVVHAVQPYAPPTPLDRYAHHVQLGTFFLAGVVAYLYRESIPRSYGWVEVAGLVTLATAVFEIGFVELLPLTGTYLLLTLAYEPKLAPYGGGWRTDLSYGVYLYAWPVQQSIVQAAGPWLNPWTLSLAALAGSAGLAWLSWHLVERPALRLKHRSARRGPEAVPGELAAQPAPPNP